MSNPLTMIEGLTGVAGNATPGLTAAKVQKASKAAEDAPQAAAGTQTASGTFLTGKARTDAVDAVRKQLNKQFSTTNSIVSLGSKVGKLMPSAASGIYTLDFGVIGTGGIPRGRIVEFYGAESGGKSSLALAFVSAEQNEGNAVAYVDAEHALDPSYMQMLGVNVNELLVSQPDSGEQALETVEYLIESKAVSLIVVDSVAALVPQAELDGDAGDAAMGAQARLMSQAMRKLRGKASINGVCVIFINQIREKIGVMFGNPETTTGGRALKFYASVRLSISRVGGTDGQIKSGELLLGHKVKIRAVKNKVGVPAKDTVVDLIYGKGFDKFADFVTYAKEAGVIEQAGAWYSFKGERIGQGLKNVIDGLRDNKETFSAIEEEVKKYQAAQLEADLS